MEHNSQYNSTYIETRQGINKKEDYTGLVQYWWIKLETQIKTILCKYFHASQSDELDLT